MKRTRGLARIDRRARRLIDTGAMAATMWGAETLGLGPTRTKRIRAGMAGATGLNQAQRCATTAVWVAGLIDPAVRTVKQLLGAWMRLLGWKGITPNMRKAWREAHKKIVRMGKVAWSAVRGPIGALIATLSGHGWDMSAIECWGAPNDRGLYRYVPGEPYYDFVEFVAQTASETAWDQAAQHYCGGGLQTRGPAEASLKLVKSMRANDDAEGAGILECLLVGGSWFPDRLRLINKVLGVCPVCGMADVDTLHCLWTCKALETWECREVKDTQDMVHDAVVGCGDYACFWLRGGCP